MAPVDVKKGSPAKKQRLSLGDADDHVWTNPLEPTNYALIYPDTQLVCGGCFSKVEDICQHVSKRAACALYLAIRHLLYCYQANCMSGFRPNPVVVGAMCLDKDCPLSARDLIAQPNEWDPRENFVGGLRNGHTVNVELATTSFHTLYTDYLTTNPQMDDARRICQDITTVACHKATSVSNLPRWMQTSYDAYYNARVAADVAAGKLRYVRANEEKKDDGDEIDLNINGH